MSESVFKGGVVIIYTRNRGRGQQWCPTLAKPELVNIGGRTFIAGLLLTRGSGHWGEGKRWYVPVGDIVHIVEFDSQQDFEDANPHSSRKRLRRFWKR